MLALLGAFLMAFPKSAHTQNASVTERGTPIQGVHYDRSEIEVAGGNPKIDRYRLALDDVGMFKLFSMATGANGNMYAFQMAAAGNLISGRRLDVPATYLLSGKWVAIGEVENTLPSKRDQDFGAVLASQLSSEESTEFGQSLGATVEVSGEPFGIGISESISGALNWNKTTSTGTSEGKEINTGASMKYGTGMQAWQFVGIVVIQVDCRTAFQSEAEFRAAMERACGRANDASGPYNWAAFKSQGVLTFRQEIPTKKIAITEYPIPGYNAGQQSSQSSNSAELAALRAQLAEADANRAEAERQRMAAEATAAAQEEAARQLQAAAEAEAARQAQAAATARTEAEAAAARQAAAAASQLAAANKARAAKKAAAKRRQAANKRKRQRNVGNGGKNNDKGKGKGGHGRQ